MVVSRARNPERWLLKSVVIVSLLVLSLSPFVPAIQAHPSTIGASSSNAIAPTESRGSPSAPHPLINGPPGPAVWSTHWWAGSVYNGATTTANKLAVNISVPDDTPDISNFYYVLLSAWDSANSYDQIGFAEDEGGWGITYSWTSNCAGSYYYNPDVKDVTRGQTYDFVMTIAGGTLVFYVNDSKGNSVWTDKFSSGGDYFEVQSTSTACGGDYGYTDYEEAYYTTQQVPSYDLFFTNNLENSKGETAMAAFNVGGPSSIVTSVSGTSVTVENQPFALSFAAGAADQASVSLGQVRYWTNVSLQSLASDGTITLSSLCLASGWSASYSPVSGSSSYIGAVTVDIPAAATAGTYCLRINATDASHHFTIVRLNITLSGSPSLASVAVAPTSVAVPVGGSSNFTATPKCNGGSCPSGTSYVWSLTNGAMGTLNSTTGQPVVFHANSTIGTLALFVNATLSGNTVSSSAMISIQPSLSSVSVSPATNTTPTGGKTVFAATPTCLGGTCPGGTTYSWTLTNSAMGSLSAATGQPVTFTAGSTIGTVGLFVNASLNGKTVLSSATITMIPGLSSVGVSPSSWTLPVTQSQTFSATPTCTGGTCPLGTTFSWVLTNSAMGSLNATIGQPVTFTAASTIGTVGLFVNASLDGKTVLSSVIITIVPGLSSVGVSPSSKTLPVTENQTFSATPTCIGGTCPPGTTFSWTITNPSMGTLSGATSQSPTFYAGTTTGTLALFVNATLNGKTVMSSATTITIEPGLSSVTVSPSTDTISMGGTATFSTTVVCTGGTCPAGTSFSWTLTAPTLGSLNLTTGQSVTFTAGSAVGTLTLFVNATLNGQTVRSSAMITIAPALSSVTISPASETLSVGGEATFAATPSCSGEPCPAGTTFAWTLTRSAMGTLNAGSGQSVTFTAKNTAGTVTLFVNATLNGVTIESSATITMLPGLASVSVSPSSETLSFGGSVTFTASITCTGGACPTGATYSWKLTSAALGSLGAATGQSVTFTAGSTAGTLALFVNATLNGKTVEDSVTIVVSAALTSVSVSPPSEALLVGGTATFTATPTCSGGTCPSGVTVTWTLTNILGTVSASSGLTVTFTAGSSAGTDTLFANATLGGVIVRSAPVPIAISPALSSVSLSPSSDTILTGGIVTFTATPSCTGGQCPSGTTYSWSLTSKLGTISASTGSSVEFTAGNQVGTVTLFMNATLAGKTVTTSAVITINAQPSSTTLGLTGTTFYLLIIVVVAVIVVVLVVVMLHHRKGHPQPVDAPMPPAPSPL